LKYGSGEVLLSGPNRPLTYEAVLIPFRPEAELEQIAIGRVAIAKPDTQFPIFMSTSAP
jgi:hypothetical protein